MKKILFTVFSFCALAPSAMAQKEAPKFLRFFAIGDLPAWKQKLIDGVLVGKVAKGALPPDPVSLVTGGGVVPFQLPRKSFSELLKLDAATEGLTLKAGKTPDSPTLLQKPKPTASLSLGVLYANPADMKWEKPKMLMLEDDAKNFPAGTMRFVNVSDRVIILQIGEGTRRFGVAAGATSSAKPIKVGKDSDQSLVSNCQPGGSVDLG